jgi:hypothetical protein
MSLYGLPAEWKVGKGPDRTRRVHFQMDSFSQAESLLPKLNDLLNEKGCPYQCSFVSKTMNRITYDLLDRSSVDKLFKALTTIFARSTVTSSPPVALHLTVTHTALSLTLGPKRRNFLLTPLQPLTLDSVSPTPSLTSAPHCYTFLTPKAFPSLLAHRTLQGPPDSFKPSLISCNNELTWAPAPLNNLPGKSTACLTASRTPRSVLPLPWLAYQLQC